MKEDMVTYSKKVPEGWAMVDWKDGQGNVWKDVIPKDYVIDFSQKKGVYILKVKYSEDDKE